MMEILINDIYLFAVGIKLTSEKHQILEALKFCSIIENKINKIEDENLKSESLIIYYWYANLYYSINDNLNTLKYINHALNLIENTKRERTSMIDEKGITTIKDQLIQIKRSLPQNKKGANVEQSDFDSKILNRRDRRKQERKR
jgi:uncharacterized protein YybS (DUF2232 family)